MCRRNGRGDGKIVAAIWRTTSKPNFLRNEALGGWEWRRSMGIWEAGPTVIVYYPASQVTKSDRLLHTVVLPDLGRELVQIQFSADHLKLGPTECHAPQPSIIA